jgi:ribosomal peptide maturation radical SAM protein 1
MYTISLVNMPFANIELPSIALAQIKSLLQSQFGEKLSVRIVHANHDFARFLGLNNYRFVSTSMQALYAGLGDWFFRRQAFPELPDNTDKYLRRYFWSKGGEQQHVKEMIEQKLPTLSACMDELITKYELDKSEIVGFTSMFMQNAASFAMARRLKQRNPKVITVMGGANCEFPMGRVIAQKMEYIDFVFSGPALKSFTQFVEYWLNGDISKSRSIRGVYSQDASLPAAAGLEALGEELSIDVPIEVDYQDFVRQFDEYFANTDSRPILPFETSRGCWWGQRAHCTFCGLNSSTMPYRAMKPALAIEQFKALFRYEGAVSMLQAVDNILPKNYLAEVLPFLETPSTMEIFYEVKADLSEKDFATLAKSRVNQVQPGIESLATSTLKLMKKGTTAFQNVGFLKMSTLYGVKPSWNLLIGFPGENAEVYRQYLEVIPRLVHLEPPAGIFPVRFDRFSPYHSQAAAYKLDLKPMDCYSFIYPFDEATLHDFVYYFSDRNLAAEYFTNMVQWIGKLQAAVGQWRELWEHPKQGGPPRLEFKGDSDIVFDSRSGSAIEYPVGLPAKSILDYLAKPARIEEIMKVFSPQYGADITAQIEFLRKKELVFEEGDRLLSLILNRDSIKGEESIVPVTGTTVEETRVHA